MFLLSATEKHGRMVHHRRCLPSDNAECELFPNYSCVVTLVLILALSLAGMFLEYLETRFVPKNVVKFLPVNNRSTH